MIIHLNPEWRIKSDPLQWIVQQRRAVKGRDKWDSLSFHHSLDGAILWVAQRRVRSLEGVYGPDALPHLCRTLDSLKSEILSATANHRNLLAASTQLDADERLGR